MLNVNTMSIVARDPRTGAVGAATATKLPAVGALVPRAVAGVGAIVTQAWTNPLLAVDAAALLAEGRSAGDALDASLATDPAPEIRQIAVMPAVGTPAVHTGAKTDPWKGHLVERNHVVVGNLLVDGSTLEAMSTAFEDAADATFAERLVAAMLAGHRAGGDKRGTRSAALTIATTEPYPYLDLRVDDHDHPTDELARLHDLAVEHLLPFVEALPTRAEPGGHLDRSVREDIVERSTHDVPLDG
ncbi:MAG: DUF1028 domain-containing protein [Actinomycetota bacterium]|nr:DUF1028 domain-containing protein [Actinomycetota bacterium]